MLRKVMTLPSGRIAKWAIVAIWVALMVPAFLLAANLGDVEKNDSSAWLPSNAEATRVLDQSKKFQPAETLPAIVIYDRPEGVTSADMAKAEADAEAFQGIEKVVGPPQGPSKSQDGKAILTVVQVDDGSEGWNGAHTVVGELTTIGQQSAHGLGFHVTGPAGYASDSITAFSGGGALGMITALVVVVILLFTYRSPVLLAAAAPDRGRRAGHRGGGDLPPGQARRPDRQRAEPGHPDRAGVRRRHRLRAAAHRPVPGGAAPPRGPARGDGGRPAPRRSRRSSPAPRRSSSACSACCWPTLNSTKGLGPVVRHRRRRGPARHDHPAAGAAGHLRPLDVLAGQADRTARPGRPTTASGRGSAPRIARRPADRVGRHRAGPRSSWRSA